MWVFLTSRKHPGHLLKVSPTIYNFRIQTNSGLYRLHYNEIDDCIILLKWHQIFLFRFFFVTELPSKNAYYSSPSSESALCFCPWKHLKIQVGSFMDGLSLVHRPHRLAETAFKGTEYYNWNKLTVLIM